jgi:serine/threonine protein kinase
MAWQQLVGRLLADRYRLTHFIDAGSFGGVYEADEVVADVKMRSVALKLLRPPIQNRDGQPPTPEQRDALIDQQLHEMQLATRLEHPHLIRSYSVGIVELDHPVPAGLHGELLFIIMELGESTLLDLLKDRPLLTSEVMELTRQLLSVLHYLHEGADLPNHPVLVHRDIKPANILRVPNLRGGFRWKLTDMCTLQAAASYSAVPSAQIGTVEYASPESFSGHCSPAGDMWSLGVLLCEALTGKLPFENLTEASDPAAVQHEILNATPRMPGQLARPLDVLLPGLLMKDAKQRLSAAQALALLASAEQSLSAATDVRVPAQPLPSTAAAPSASVNRPPLTAVADLAHDSPADAHLRNAVRSALEDKVLSPFERSELNELRKRLDIRLERAAQIFREEHARAENPSLDSAPAGHSVSPASPLLSPPAPDLPAPNTQSVKRAGPPAPRPDHSFAPPFPTGQLTPGTRRELVVDADVARNADFRTISEAIAAAPSGSRIQIRTGVYREQLQLDKPLELCGYDSQAEVLIQSSARHGIIVNCDGVVLRRLHVSAGQSGSGTTSDLAVSPLVISRGRMEAENCIFECHSENCVAAFGATSLAMLRHCEIRGGRSVGLSASHDARVVGENCFIHGCGLAGASASNGGTLRLRQCRITQCRGYGVLAYVDGMLTLRECEVRGNSQHGVALKNGGRGELERCILSGNGGSGILIQAGCNAVVRGCDLRGNRGRAFEIQRGASVQRESNLE